MSRIYDNKPVSALSVDTVNWKGQWSVDRYQTGVGVLIEGCIKGRSRHVIVDATGRRTHYTAVHIEVRRAHRRRFDRSGLEVEPNFSETQKVCTGYLNSSYQTVAKGNDDTLAVAETEKIVLKPELLQVTQRHNLPKCLPFWIEETNLQGIELDIGFNIRARTKGDGPFIESITTLADPSVAVASNVSNFSGGEQIGGAWTDKIMAYKADNSNTSDVASHQPGDAAADEEWDD